VPRADARDRQAHTRAVNRASSDLRKRYPEDYQALYRMHLAEAKGEAYAHEGLAFKPGPRAKSSPSKPLVQPPAPPGECPGCKVVHGGGHVCWDCGADLTQPPSQTVPVSESRDAICDTHIASRDRTAELAATRRIRSEGGKPPVPAAGRRDPSRILPSGQGATPAPALAPDQNLGSRNEDEPPHGYDRSSPSRVATMRRMHCENCGRDGRWMREPCVAREGRRDRRYVSHQYTLIPSSAP